MKPIFRTDLSLAILGLGSLVSGILIHYAGHFESHNVWHNLSVLHFFVNVAFLITTMIHIKQHWGWFRGLLKKSSLKKKVALFVTIAFLTVSLSGIYLLAFTEGQGTHAGVVHYVLGLIFGLLAILHLTRRWSVFRKGVFTQPENHNNTGISDNQRK